MSSTADTDSKQGADPDFEAARTVYIQSYLQEGEDEASHAFLDRISQVFKEGNVDAYVRNVLEAADGMPERLSRIVGGVRDEFNTQNVLTPAVQEYLNEAQEHLKTLEDPYYFLRDKKHIQCFSQKFMQYLSLAKASARDEELKRLYNRGGAEGLSDVYGPNID